MAKKKQYKKKNDIGLWIFGILLLLLLWKGYNDGWLEKFQSSSGNFFQSGSLPIGFPNPNNVQDTSGYNLNLEIIPHTICSGDSVTGRITSNMPNAMCGVFTSVNNNPWQPLGSVMLDSNGRFQDSDRVYAVGEAKFIAVCCDAEMNCKISNIAPLSSRDCTTPPSYNVGDVVGGGSGSGTITGSSGLTKYFDLSGIATGGDCYLGAKVKVTWNYKDPYYCDYMQGIGQGVYVSFFDSSGLVWDEYSNNPPKTLERNFCPLYWDGVTPWKLMVEFADAGLTPSCEIEYSYNVEINVCYCHGVN
jgi:hypothetical protein